MNTSYIGVGVAAVVIGLAFAGAGWIYIVPYQADTSNAEGIDAVVISSDVIESTDVEGQNQKIYEPSVTYRYTYEGSEYTSSTVFPGDVNPVNDQSRAQEIVERYSPGEEVTAYVNTEDPASAFLIDRSAPLWFWAGPIIGLLSILYGVYSIVLGIRDVEPSSASL
jgi:Protein of unknown function (DUF3592).